MITYMRVSVLQIWRVIRLIVLIVGDYTMSHPTANQGRPRPPRAVPQLSGGQHYFSGMCSLYENDNRWGVRRTLASVSREESNKGG
jgi:hypothetical protein